MLETTHAKREIAIQLSAPMVRATLDATKTVTRRTVKGEIPAGAVRAVFGQWNPGAKHSWRWLDQHGAPVGKPFRCPYGVAGDILRGLEAWRVSGKFDQKAPREIAPRGCTVFFEAGGSAAHEGEPLEWMLSDWPRRPGPIPEWVGKFRPGMFMPRWASRILLEVIDIRVERLQDITREQAIAEGIERVGDRWRHYFFPEDDSAAWEFPQNSFASLWDKLNGEGAWDSSPWVFCISFRRISP